MRGLRSEDEMKHARDAAIELAKELGTSYDGLPCAVAASKGEYGPDRWLIDTGSAFDLVGQHDVPDWNLELAEMTEDMIELSTANGRMNVDKEVLMQVGPLKRHIKPLLLSNTPPVLSVGKRCMEEGFSFHWPANEAPYLVGPNGKRHQLEIDNLVPYLPDPLCFRTIMRTRVLWSHFPLPSTRMRAPLGVNPRGSRSLRASMGATPRGIEWSPTMNRAMWYCPLRFPTRLPKRLLNRRILKPSLMRNVLFRSESRPIGI